MSKTLKIGKRAAVHSSGRRIYQNVWGNWNGYIGRKKVEEFGTRDDEAKEWLETGKVEREPFKSN